MSGGARRVCGREAFAALRESAHRGHQGAVRARWVPFSQVKPVATESPPLGAEGIDAPGDGITGAAGSGALEGSGCGEAGRHVAAAFAIPRQVGTAVLRNRIRRRLKGALRDVTAEVPEGCYLIGATRDAATTRFVQLTGDLRAAMHMAASGRRSR